MTNQYHSPLERRWAAWNSLKEQFRIIMELTHEEVDELLEGPHEEPPPWEIQNKVLNAIIRDWEEKNEQQ